MASISILSSTMYFRHCW